MGAGRTPGGTALYTSRSGSLLPSAACLFPDLGRERSAALGRALGSLMGGGSVGWDRWDRSAVPVPAPLPTYQRQYSGNRYPHVDQQQVLQTQNAPPLSTPPQQVQPSQQQAQQRQAEQAQRTQQQAQQRQTEQTNARNNRRSNSSAISVPHKRRARARSGEADS